jgi:hypothetical protein
MASEKVLADILVALVAINASIVKLSERIDSQMIEFKEFSERFEEVVTQLEDERRLDLIDGHFN